MWFYITSAFLFKEQQGWLNGILATHGQNLILITSLPRIFFLKRFASTTLTRYLTHALSPPPPPPHPPPHSFFLKGLVPRNRKKNYHPPPPPPKNTNLKQVSLGTETDSYDPFTTVSNVNNYTCKSVVYSAPFITSKDEDPYPPLFTTRELHTYSFNNCKPTIINILLYQAYGKTSFSTRWRIKMFLLQILTCCFRRLSIRTL